MKLSDKFEIIDFHMHTALVKEQIIYYYRDECKMDADTVLKVYDELGISHFCGTVLGPKVESCDKPEMLRRMIKDNDDVIALHEIYGDRYIPGFKVNPHFLRESCEEIERMHRLGHRLIGELVPYMDGWIDLQSSRELSEILELAGEYNMIVNIHDEESTADDIDFMIRNNKNVTFVIAHPSAFTRLDRNISRMKMRDNVYIDLSGNGMTYNGIARHIVNEVGSDRILFGSDFPICNIGAFAGSVIFDPFLSDTEKERILALNARRLLGMGGA